MRLKRILIFLMLPPAPVFSMAFAGSDSLAINLPADSIPMDTLSAKDHTTALLLAIGGGMIGAHRWYLGTSVPTAVAYAITLGGGFVVWIVDIVHLIVHDDLTPYINNQRFFMWSRKKKERR